MGTLGSITITSSRCEKLTYVLISGANTMVEMCPEGFCRIKPWKQWIGILNALVSSYHLAVLYHLYYYIVIVHSIEFYT